MTPTIIIGAILLGAFLYLSLWARRGPSEGDLARADALVDDAMADKARGDSRDALVKLVAALRVSRLQDSRALFEAAVIYHENGEDKSAVLALKRVLQKHPDDASARELLEKIVRPTA
ncbi:MAG TPA: hypothetical protein VID24_06980 [Candidatus Eremiobacteraceae bacterium]|jgi:cytochrome c-type biogenesis protein CcmH/NrfG